MKPSRKIPPTYASPRSLPSYPTAAKISGSSPPGVIDPSRCHHLVRIYCCDQKKFVCVNCGLREYATLKIGANGINLPDGHLHDYSHSRSVSFGSQVGSAPPRRE